MSNHECCKGESHKAAGACCKDQAPDLKAYDPKALMEHVRAMDATSLCMRYRRGIEAVDRRVFELTEKQVDAAFLPDAGVGAWPVRVLVGHVADAEIVFVERMRRAVGEENPVVSVWDENSFVDSGIYGNGDKQYAEVPRADHMRMMASVGGPLAVVHTLRQWTGQWLLSLPEAAWSRKILHPERGEMTLKQILEYATWHLEHHAVFLARKVEKMLGPAPAPTEEAGSCGSGCGCGH
jgi:uncharacterized damage-inducible protein DinB